MGFLALSCCRRLTPDNTDNAQQHGGGSVQSGYDVFISYSWADHDAVQPLAQALRNHGLRVFIDDSETDDFVGITTTITQHLAASRVLLAYYSRQYPTRRACQWELTTAYLAAQRTGDPSRRILILNPEPTLEHLHPGELRDALAGHPPADGDPIALSELAQAAVNRVQEVPTPLGEIAPLVPPRWLPTPRAGLATVRGTVTGNMAPPLGPAPRHHPADCGPNCSGDCPTSRPRWKEISKIFT
jgi:hypothetical protein